MVINHLLNGMILQVLVIAKTTNPSYRVLKFNVSAVLLGLPSFHPLALTVFFVGSCFRGGGWQQKLVGG